MNVRKTNPLWISTTEYGCGQKLWFHQQAKVVIGRTLQLAKVNVLKMLTGWDAEIVI